MTTPLPYRIITGGIHRDVRGIVRHVNQFGVENVDRFYTIAPAKLGVVRGWVGHRRDWKWLFAIKGRFEVGIVQPKDWGNPSRKEKVAGIRLDSDSPCILEIPPGNFTASRSLDENAMLLVFSSGKIEASSTDDFRLSSDYWIIPDEGMPQG